MHSLLYARFILGLAFLTSTVGVVQAQWDTDEWYYGIKAGATYSSIDEIATTLIRPIHPQETYSTSINPSLGFSASAFVFLRFPKSAFAVQPEIGYADLGGQFDYTDINDLAYTINFRLNYLRLAPVIKFYPVAGLNVSTGASCGFILNGNRLTYTSNQPEIGPDLQIQQSLREVLKGRGNVGLIAGIGYELPGGLGLDFRYLYGFTDVIETQANGFYFIENKNTNTAFEFTLSYAFPFFR